MEWLNNLLNRYKAWKKRRQRKKRIKRFKKGLKKALSKENITKAIIIIATLSMLLPLVLPFL